MSIITWLSVTIATLCVAAGLAAIVGGVRAAAGRRRSGEPSDPTLRAVRSALLVGLVAAFAAAAVTASIDGAHPGWLGLPLALAPGLAVIVGLAVIASTPARSASPGPVRSAELAPRSAWTVGSRWHYRLPALSGGALIVLLLVTGLTGGADDAGLQRALTVSVPGGSNTASPYPGWFYAGPLLAATALLLLTAVLAMRRIAALPALDGPSAAADHAWRQAATAAVSRLATAGLLGYLAGCLLATASSVLSAGSGTPLVALGWALLALAVAAAALACVMLGLALGAAAAFRVGFFSPTAVTR